MDIKNQREVIAKHLEKYGKITSFDAINGYRITRLSAVIYDLRHRGYCIETDRKEVSTQYGNTMIAVYKLVEPYFVGDERNRFK